MRRDAFKAVTGDFHVLCSLELVADGLGDPTSCIRVVPDVRLDLELFQRLVAAKVAVLGVCERSRRALKGPVDGEALETPKTRARDGDGEDDPSDPSDPRRVADAELAKVDERADEVREVVVGRRSSVDRSAQGEAEALNERGDVVVGPERGAELFELGSGRDADLVVEVPLSKGEESSQDRLDRRGGAADDRLEGVVRKEIDRRARRGLRRLSTLSFRHRGRRSRVERRALLSRL